MSTEPRSPDEPRGRETTARPEAPLKGAQSLEREVPVPAPSVSPAEALEIATDAYVYAYPMVLLQLTARTMTNVVDAETGRAPVNQFAHMRTFPDPTFTDVVRPNVDTLYSSLFFDVASDPLVIDVPDSAERYYLLPMLDWWTDVFASPGKRTTGTAMQRFAIVGPRGHGTLPPGVNEIRSPTSRGWMIGRTQTNGERDYDATHVFQDRLSATPLKALGKRLPPEKGTRDPRLDERAPLEQVDRMDAESFWAVFANAVAANAPHANDYPMLDRLQRIGVSPGRGLDLAALLPASRQAMQEGVKAARERIDIAGQQIAARVNQWDMILAPVGTYGTDYLRRAAIAKFGLGANVPDDAIYPCAFVDAQGKPLDSTARYTIHFDKGKTPPARAFWSITMYDRRQLLAANPIKRYAIGDRSDLQYNADGSLDLYLQRESPGKERERNWLPTPAEGPFSLTMRIYWPKPEVAAGRWAPPPVKRTA
jgi:hypothetical protein